MPSNLVAGNITSLSKDGSNEVSMTLNAPVAAKLRDQTGITFAGVTGSAADDFNTLLYLQRTSATTFKLFETQANAAPFTLSDPVTVAGNVASATVADPSGGTGTLASQIIDYVDLKTDNCINSVTQCPFVKNENISGYATGTNTVNTNLEDIKITSVTNAGTDSAPIIRLGIQPKKHTTTGGDFADVGTYFLSKTIAKIEADAGNSFKPRYIIDEVELVLQKIVMPQAYVGSMMKSMKEAGQLRYDFNAMQTYKYSMVMADTEGTIMLPLQNSRAKAVLCCPVNVNAKTVAAAVSGTDVGFAFRGITDFITEYRFLYNGKMNPDRPVPLSLVNSNLQEQQHLIELDKALAVSGITPASMQQFDKCFIVPRAFSLQGGSYDTRSKDFQLQVSYRDGTPVKNKLWHIFVSHIRSLVVQQGNLMVQV